MIITKLSGAKEDFSEEKLTLGLQNSGINPTTISFVVSQIREKLYQWDTHQKTIPGSTEAAENLLR